VIPSSQPGKSRAHPTSASDARGAWRRRRLSIALAAALAIVSLVVAALVLVLILRSSERCMPLARQLALGFLLGGAVGNGIDRWRLGAVIDFLALVPVSFPVFNLADVSINLAVACFAIELVRSPRQGDG
jgi:signal peptidase II